MNFGFNKDILLMMTEHGKDILSSKTYLKELDFKQHGTTSTYTHSLAVTYTSIVLAKRMKMKINMTSLIRGALLHDYFLYDWHKKNKWHSFHGYTHAARALSNASRDYPINDTEARIIRSHMFPLNLTKVPSCKEAWIVCMADKICATAETLHRANYSEALSMPLEKVLA